jgi:type I restriction-modification system DNA methylase subunit
VFISRLISVLEKNIQIELYRVLKNLVAKKFSFNNIEFVGVKFEPTINGRPDLVVEAIDRGEKLNLLVIETKRKVPFIDHKFDPYSTDVIKQASGYANSLGAPYFATCNGEVLVLFKTFKVGVPLLQRKLKHYKVSFDEEFAKTILEEVCRFEVGLGKWLELDDVFLHRLRTFHDSITPLMLESLNRQLNEDLVFKWRYRAWLKSQFFGYSRKMNETITEQLAWVFMNRLTFYKTLETQVPDLQKLRKVETEDPREFQNMLKALFERVCKNVDYEPIFEPHTILDHMLLPKKLIYVLNDFIEELGTYDLAKIRSDVIGRVYEELIPDVERHRLGQYYTPPPIIELITEMCIKSPNDKILDPACGSGGFLVKAYHKLRNLKKKESPFAENDKLHEEILNQLYGIDINAFPAQLSTINLAVRNLNVTSRNINIVVRDFFKVKPSTDNIPKELDVVVTNPPFTRQEEMEYKNQIRDEALTYSDSSEIEMDARAGIYAYFFTHSAKFLTNGGRMGYITSNTWLDVGFGEGLKSFFLKHFKIKSIVEFEKRAFEKADVTTCVIILEKYDGDNLAQQRNEHLTKFVRVKKSVDVNKIINFIETTNRNYEDDKIRIVCVKQEDLGIKDKWGMKYLRAPSVWFKIIKHPKITRLEEIAKVRRGFTTGAVEFFCLDKEKVKEWGIEKRYLQSVAKEPSKIKFIDILLGDLDEFLLMVHDDKAELKKNEANVLKYIEYGEETPVPIKKGVLKGKELIGYQKLETVQARQRWYDLGERKPAPIIICRFIEDRVLALWNKDRAMATDNFYEVHPFNERDIPIMLGFLHSSLGRLVLELQGRHTGRGAIQLMVYEVEDLLTLNPEKLDQKEKKNVEHAFLRFCKAKRNNDERTEKEARNDLDNAVFDILGLNENERSQIYQSVESLREMRLQRREVEVLVETAEKWKPHKKPKKRKMVKPELSKRLDVWMDMRTTA